MQLPSDLPMLSVEIYHLQRPPKLKGKDKFDQHIILKQFQNVSHSFLFHKPPPPHQKSTIETPPYRVTSNPNISSLSFVSFGSFVTLNPITQWKLKTRNFWWNFFRHFSEYLRSMT